MRQDQMPASTEAEARDALARAVELNPFLDQRAVLVESDLGGD